jgi:hypothetical protein
MLETINMYWDGSFSKSVQLCIDSFVKQGHKVTMWGYKENPFANCDFWNANVIVKKSVMDSIFCNSTGIGNIIDQSDWFRSNLIYEIGGWYADTDCYCIKPLEFEEQNIVSYIGLKQNSFNNNIFRFEANSPIIKHYIETFDFNNIIPGYLHFDKIIQYHLTELRALESSVLSGTLADLEDSNLDVKVLHLKCSIDSIKNLALINKINYKLNVGS